MNMTDKCEDQYAAGETAVQGVEGHQLHRRRRERREGERGARVVALGGWFSL